MFEQCARGAHGFFFPALFLGDTFHPQFVHGTKCVCGEMLLVPGVIVDGCHDVLAIIPVSSPAAAAYLARIFDEGLTDDSPPQPESEDLK